MKREGETRANVAEREREPPHLAAVVELEVSRGFDVERLRRDDAVAAGVLGQPPLDVQHHTVHHDPHAPVRSAHSPPRHTRTSPRHQRHGRHGRRIQRRPPQRRGVDVFRLCLRGAVARQSVTSVTSVTTVKSSQ